MDKTRGRAYLISAILLFTLVALSIFPLGVGHIAFADDNINEECVMAVHYINVGQGDSTFIELPDGKTMLIDAGGVDAGKTVVEYLHTKGISKINYVIATHSDEDHIGGFAEVFKAIEAENIYRPFVISESELLEEQDDLKTLGLTTGQVLTETSDYYATFINLAYKETYNNEPSNIYTNSSAVNNIVSTNASLPFTYEFVYPLASENSFETISGRTSGYFLDVEVSDVNTMSGVSLLTFGEHGFLFMADATENTEKAIINYASLPENQLLKERLEASNVIKVAHHGSKDSSTKDFLNLVTPKIAIFSVGANNDYGHPNQDTVNRLTEHCGPDKVFRTDITGNVVIKIGESGSMYAIVQSQKPKNKIIPSWIVYTVLGSTIGAIVALSVVQVIKNKLKKDDGEEQGDGADENGTSKVDETTAQQNVKDNVKTKKPEAKEEIKVNLIPPKDFFNKQ